MPWEMGDTGLGAGASINSVTVYVRAKRYDATNEYFRICIRTNAADYDNGSDILLGSSYSNNSKQWLTNPNTGAAWTVAQVDALEAGAYLTITTSQGARVSQVWVIVDYTPGAGIGTGGAASLVGQ